MKKYRIIKQANVFYPQWSCLGFWFHFDAGFGAPPACKTPEEAETFIKDYINFRKVEIIKEFEVVKEFNTE